MRFGKGLTGLVCVCICVYINVIITPHTAVLPGSAAPSYVYFDESHCVPVCRLFFFLLGVNGRGDCVCACARVPSNQHGFS